MATVSPMPRVDGTKLRRYRHLALMSQGDLVRASGISRDTISRIEGGEHSAHTRTIKKLAAALGVDPRELLDLE